MNLTPCSVKHHPACIPADCIGEFRAMRRWREWSYPEMSKLVFFLVNNDEADAHKNNFEIGFVKGTANHSAYDGDLVFCPDMKHYTTEKYGLRSRYKFDNGTFKKDPHDCWYLIFRKLQTQAIVRYKQVRNTTQDPLLRDNTECPCCLDKLEGVLFQCPNDHQIDYKCYDKLVSPKKCPSCRTRYNADQTARFNLVFSTKEFITRDLHFTGSVIQRERKLCGLFGELSAHEFLDRLIYAGLFYYLDESHLPLLEHRGDHSVFNLGLLGNPAWADFCAYLLSDIFCLNLFLKTEKPCASHHYSQADFLTHLTAEHGAEAMNILTEVSRDTSGTPLNKLRFQMYFKYVFRSKTPEFIKERISAVLGICFFKQQYHSRAYDLIESEIVEPLT